MLTGRFHLVVAAGSACALSLLAGCRQNPSPAAAESSAPDALIYPHTRVLDAERGLAYEARDPAFATVVDTGAAVEVLASGFDWSEGPVWVGDPDPKLLFSDVPGNVVYVWRPGNVADSAPGAPGASPIRGVDTFLYPSGYFADPDVEGEPGANGLLLDAEGRLLLAQHGERRVARFRHNLADPEHTWQYVSKPESFESLVDTYDPATQPALELGLTPGPRRFNSPNDLALAADGTLYFTDPTYGVDKTFGEAARELPFSGVYALRPGESEPELLIGSMTRPNGVVVTRDQSALLIANSQAGEPRWWSCRFADRPPNAENPWCEVFADASALVGPENPGNADGMVALDGGYLLATGPGGVLVFDAAGQHLGTIRTGRATANVTTGGADGRDVFITADDLLLRARLR